MDNLILVSLTSVAHFFPILINGGYFDTLQSNPTNFYPNPSVISEEIADQVL